ncbi:MAG: ROK family protein [Clostridiales bacterium]|nr:ROK family protein [Clostridiales bacterium]
MRDLPIAALDIGGTTLKAALPQAGGPMRRVEAPTRAAEGADRVLERAADLLRSLAPFAALGVSTAGMVDPISGIMGYANDNIPGYTGTDVKGFFARRFGVPTAVVNDANAAALGEGALGAAADCPDFFCVVYGTGIGAGLVLDGTLRLGAGGAAGEAGALIVHPEDIVPGDPFSGCYERYASASALVAAARAMDPSIRDGRAVFARLEEPPVAALVDRWLDEVAHGLCSLIHLLQPRRVVLGGGIMEQPYAVEGARRRVLARLIPVFRPVSIVGARLGNMAALYGAARLAGDLLAP